MLAGVILHPVKPELPVKNPMYFLSGRNRAGAGQHNLLSLLMGIKNLHADLILSY